MFNIFKKTKSQNNLPFSAIGSGVSIDDPVKITPDDLNQLVEGAYKVFSERGQVDLIPGSTHEKLINLRSVVGETCKGLYLEQRFGRKGEDYFLQDRTYLKNTSIQIQKISTKDNAEFDIFFDFSSFGSEF